MSEDSRRRLQEHTWHDAKLIELKIAGSTGIVDDVELLIDRPVAGAAGRSQRVIVKLLGCRVLRVDIDLLGKRFCADDIQSVSLELDGGAGEHLRSRSRQTFDLPDTRLPLDSLGYVRVVLIPPGGQIEALVRDVEYLEA